jgi:hypothetical protein
MKIIKEGVWYELECTDKSNQGLVFLHKDEDTGKIIQGTTTEEVILCMINRLETLNKRSKSFENVSAIRNLNAALYDVKQRIKNKSERKQKYKEKSKDFDLVVNKVTGGLSPGEVYLTIEPKESTDDEKW